MAGRSLLYLLLVALLLCLPACMAEQSNSRALAPKLRSLSTNSNQQVSPAEALRIEHAESAPVVESHSLLHKLNHVSQGNTALLGWVIAGRS